LRERERERREEIGNHDSEKTQIGGKRGEMQENNS
jgi:hypothetical protein